MNEKTEDFIGDAEKRIQDEILMDGFFVDVNVLTAARGDLEKQIDEKVKELKVTAVVEVMGGPITHGDGDWWDVDVVVVEKYATINRQKDGPGKTAAHVVGRLCSVLKYTDWFKINNCKKYEGRKGVAWLIQGKTLITIDQIEERGQHGNPEIS